VLASSSGASEIETGVGISTITPASSLMERVFSTPSGCTLTVSSKNEAVLESMTVLSTRCHSGYSAESRIRSSRGSSKEFSAIVEKYSRRDSVYLATNPRRHEERLESGGSKSSSVMLRRRS
jgi:hypothetical protein